MILTDGLFDLQLLDEMKFYVVRCKTFVADT